jgi:type VI secretion system secreted protein Hcp
VLITQRKRGENPIDFLKIKLKNAVVSSINHSGQGDEPGSETVTFAFEKIEKEYTPQGSDGKPQGAVSMKWDLKANKEG